MSFPYHIIDCEAAHCQSCPKAFSSEEKAFEHAREHGAELWSVEEQ